MSLTPLQISILDAIVTNVRVLHCNCRAGAELKFCSLLLLVLSFLLLLL